MKKFTILAAAVTMLMAQSCATIFSGSTATVTINSNLDTAEKLTVDNYTYHNVEFPLVLKVRRGFNSTFVVSETEGYDDAQIVIDKNFNATTLLNILLGGIIGMGIDAISGAMTKPSYPFYELHFEKSE